MKITGNWAAAAPQEEDVSPFPCILEEQMTLDTDELLLHVLDPIDSTLFTVKDDDSVALSGLQEETDFGDFLLDAVDWL